jgi:hypothetical protein
MNYHLEPGGVPQNTDPVKTVALLSKALQDRNSIDKTDGTFHRGSSAVSLDSTNFEEWDPRTVAVDILSLIEGHVSPAIRKQVADLIRNGNRLTFELGVIAGKRKARELDLAAQRSAKAMQDFHQVINERRARKGKPPLFT